MADASRPSVNRSPSAASRSTFGVLTSSRRSSRVAVADVVGVDEDDVGFVRGRLWSGRCGQLQRAASAEAFGNCVDPVRIRIVVPLSCLKWRCGGAEQRADTDALEALECTRPHRDHFAGGGILDVQGTAGAVAHAGAAMRAALLVADDAPPGGVDADVECLHEGHRTGDVVLRAGDVEDEVASSSGVSS